MIYKSTVNIILKQEHPPLSISASAREYICCHVVELFYKVVSSIIKVKHPNEQITSKILTDILQTLIDGELFKHALQEISKYESLKSVGTINCVNHGHNLENIKKFFNGINIEKKVLSLLIPCVEYLLAEFLELAGNVANDRNRKTLDTYHVFIATISDEELDQFICRLHCKDEHMRIYKISKHMLEYLGKTTDQ